MQQATGATRRVWLSEKGSRILLGALSVVGFLLSTYITWSFLSGADLVCVADAAGCEAVQSSPYSAVFGVPLTAFGIAGYAGLLASALVAGRRGAVLGLGVVGVAFASYCMWQEIFVIGALCQLCAVCATVMAASFATTIVRFRRPPGA